MVTLFYVLWRLIQIHACRICPAFYNSKGKTKIVAFLFVLLKPLERDCDYFRAGSIYRMLHRINTIFGNSQSSAVVQVPT